MSERRHRKKIPKMRIYGIIRNNSAVILTRLYLPEWQKNIIRENDYEKDTYRSYSHNYFFFMVAALYICGRYENAPDRIFTGKVSAPEGEWTIDAS